MMMVVMMMMMMMTMNRTMRHVTGRGKAAPRTSW